MNTFMGKAYIEKKEQQGLFNWLYTTIDLPKRVYEIQDMINLFNKLDFSINDEENHDNITDIERKLKLTNEIILQTLKIIKEKKKTK